MKLLMMKLLMMRLLMMRLLIMNCQEIKICSNNSHS